MVVAQLVKWSLPTLEMPGSNPVNGKLYITYLLSNVLKRQKEKKKRLGLAHFFKKKKLAYFYDFLPSGEISPKFGHTDRDRRGR